MLKVAPFRNLRHWTGLHHEKGHDTPYIWLVPIALAMKLLVASGEEFWPTAAGGRLALNIIRFLDLSKILETSTSHLNYSLPSKWDRQPISLS